MKVSVAGNGTAVVGAIAVMPKEAYILLERSLEMALNSRALPYYAEVPRAPSGGGHDLICIPLLTDEGSYVMLVPDDQETRKAVARTYGCAWL